MAVFVPSPGTAQVTLNFLWRQIPCVNTIYVQKALLTSWNAAELEGAASTVKNWWLDNMRGELGTELTLVSVKATDLTTQTAGTYTVTTGLPASGLISAETVSNVAALVIKFGTNSRGRNARGRNYVPGMIAAALIDNHWVAATANAIRTAYGELQVVLGENNLIQVVVSRYLNKIPRVTAQTFPVTSYQLTTYLVGTQRERRT